MDIFLDDERYPVDQGGSPTVGQVLQDVLQDVRARGRVIASIRCDGVEIVSENIAAVLEEPAAKYARVDFVSSMAGELAIEALSRIQSMLIELDASRTEAVDRLNQGQTQEAMQLLGRYFEAWRQAHEAVLQSARLVGLDLTELQVDDLPVAEIFGQFAEQLRQLKEAFEAKDHVTVADIMNYEADETTQRWIKLIELIKEASKGR
jgi:hypothetical protein